jgi:hypothetical protein
MANDMLTTESERRHLEEELHVEILPGTEIMAQRIFSLLRLCVLLANANSAPKLRTSTS